MRSRQLRTNVFHFDPRQLLHPVYVYRIDKRFVLSWNVLLNYWDLAHPGYHLPTRSLRDLLCVASAGPVWINSNCQAGAAWMLSLRPMDSATVELALHRWAQDVQRRLRPTNLPIVDGLIVRPPEELFASELLRASAGSSCVPDVALSWMVAAAMRNDALQTGVLAKLDITSEGELLTWDNVIAARSDTTHASAMHAIVPTLMRLAGHDELAVCVRVHMVQVAAHWRQSINHVLVKREGCVIQLAIERSRRDDASWKTTYRRGLDRLVESMGASPLPLLDDVEVSLVGPLRPLCKFPPKNALIGQGCGPLFLDQACWHLRKTVPSARPVVVDRAVKSLKRPPLSEVDRVAGSATVGPVLVVTSEATTALRLDAAARTLAAGSRSLNPSQPARFDIEYFVPPQAKEMLCEPVDLLILDEWFEKHVRTELALRGTKLAVVETALGVASQNVEQDSKFPLRVHFARCGVTTQFIFNMPASEPDYAALGCLFDVVRQSGHLPQPLPQLPSLPPGTTVIGFYLDHIRAGLTEAFFPVVTRTVLGTNTPELFVVDREGARGKWVPYHAGLCTIYARPTLWTPVRAREYIQHALTVPTDVLDTPLIVYLHNNLHHLYGEIDERTRLPKVGNQGAWIVGVRAGAGTPQISGDETAHPSEPGYIGDRVGLYTTGGASPSYFFVSPSKHYSRTRSQRRHTRFDTSAWGLRDRWHQLGVSQFNVVKPGNFGTEAAIAEQTALLCKKAPTWDGEIRLPAPLHLAMQVAKDHPTIAKHRRAFA